ncbi:zinc dhhc domain containing [Plasmopara halstedii]|uniref:Palmitoyltransferase n=1 Tax=Plasmopara halstedii TaxID=4781 RepID=A0A0N7L6E8_PLAHL|nr:zinc dhhc domain containing [Plasmopara halstedii]CEG44075.1 zinc dhhc domain containing [Plasmopara halstedii]|eukprot:XP_024580444.1 zinc dhhc domain containing [Plasmopara halstedii]
MDVNYDGQTAFDAAANGDFPLVVLLWGMSMAVQPQPVDLLATKDQNGNTLVHYAAASGEDSCDTLHFLMQQMHASGREDILMDAKNDAGETPLIRAAHVGNMQIAGALLESGFVDLLAQDLRGNTAAHHAAAQGHLWVLHFLLEAELRNNTTIAKEGKQLNCTTRGGYSSQHRNVLHYACMSEYKPMVQYLLTEGFDAKEADAEGFTCMDLAKQRNLSWLKELLTCNEKAADPPTHMRQTRGIVAILQGALLLAILATSYWLVWWIAVPLIFVVLGVSLFAFRQQSHDHSHSHGSSTDMSHLHPSKRRVFVAKNVSLESIEKGLTKEHSKKFKNVTSVGIHTIIRPQPESIMAIWIAWVGLFTLLYIVLWVDPDYKAFRKSHKVFLAIIGVIELVFITVWVRLAFFCPTDPGTITTYEQDVKIMLEMASQCETPDMNKFCRTCLVKKPIRSKHCAQCGICIARHDHHCAWINRCVGYGNHRLFLVFLLVHVIALGIYAVLIILVLSEATHDLHAVRINLSNSGDNSNLTAMDVWIEIPSLFKNHLLVMMVLLWDLMAFGAVSMMIIQHINNIEKNLTINEQMNWRRYDYLTRKSASAAKMAPKEMVNPFDRGIKKNLAEFFFRSSSTAVDYRNVFSAPGSAGNDTSPVSSETSATSEYVEEKRSVGDVV